MSLLNEKCLRMSVVKVISAVMEVQRERRVTVERVKKDKATVYDIQGELPLMELTSGVFEHMTPTLYHGQDLDIPTFQRLGINVDIGEQS